MSDASYGFLSVLRRGLAALIPTTSPASDPRIAVSASLSVGGQTVKGLPALALRGPGDVIGFDTAAISRTWPTANSNNAEPNYFTLVELHNADLPWRYSPEPATGDQQKPWLCLIVVKDSEISPLVPASKQQPLAVLTVNDAGALPDLSQAWAWAHAQVLGSPVAPATDFTPAAIGSLLASSPELLLSRLLCPRKLDPQSQYLACVVPTFERGRRAGLGQSIDGVDRLALAWKSGTAPVTLPVYFSWRFQTGLPGDFASLVHLLVARSNLPEAVWQRDLAVSPPGANPPVWQTVGLGGALRTIDGKDQPWNGLDAHGFTTALEKLTNDPNRNELAPPLYGRWLAKSATLSTDPNATPPWFHQLNADPRARIAAGLGTMVVQAEQQTLLAQAWDQVDGIRRINNRLRLSQLARELATSVHNRHLSIGGDAFLQVTAPVHGRVRAGSSTASAQLAASPIARGAVGAAWRRAARPLGSLGVRQGRPSAPVPTAANATLTRLNSGALSLLPAVASPSGTPARLGDLGTTFRNAGVPPEKLDTVPLPATFAAEIAVRPPVGGGGTAPATPTAPTPPTPPPPPTPATFAQAASALMKQLSAPLGAGAQWTRADLPGLTGSLAGALHPSQTIQNPIVARLSGVDLPPTRPDPIEPVMAAPDFPQPMYEPLKAQSQAWLVPGLDQVPPNTVAALAVDRPFVEAFLVGLNHEMARKLLWNGYPTDQRGTYFRHFWDSRSRTDGSTDGDIGPIHAWTGPLGQNHGTAVDPLVLLIRGELIRRYPNVIVYAAQGVTQNGVRQPGPTEKQPMFFARLDPDVALFGFDLDPNAARADPGWYFCLQEHPSEPRFGLAAPGTAFGAVPPSWEALGWDHLAASADALAKLRYIDLAAALPQAPATPDQAAVTWHSTGTPGTRSADLAHITFRRPQRLAIHASMLIPPGGTP
jgi:hypothetical protein